MTTRCWSVANCLAALRPGLFGKLSRGRSIYGSHTTHAAAAPYFSLVRHALGDAVEGDHFFDIVASDIAWEVLYDFPGWPH